jgi:hypothetical protein
LKKYLKFENTSNLNLFGVNMISTHTCDWDTQAQCNLFDEYLETSADIEDRSKINKGYSYNECEWEAFQHGWNACKQHFGLGIES